MKTLAPFVSLDGIDGTGKSTQCRLLIEWLSAASIPAVRCSDPGGTPIGDQLRAILLNPESRMADRTETLLFMASRAELAQQVIRPALESGTVVIADRFVSANVVYQGHAGSLPPEEIRAIGRFSAGGLTPDITFILDLPVAEAAKRRDRIADRLEQRGPAYFERIAPRAMTKPPQVLEDLRGFFVFTSVGRCVRLFFKGAKRAGEEFLAMLQMPPPIPI